MLPSSRRVLLLALRSSASTGGAVGGERRRRTTASAFCSQILSVRCPLQHHKPSRSSGQANAKEQAGTRGTAQHQHPQPHQSPQKSRIVKSSRSNPAETPLTARSGDCGEGKSFRRSLNRIKLVVITGGGKERRAPGPSGA